MGPQKFAQPRLGWWGCLLLLWLLLLQVRLQMLKSLQHYLHQLVLVGNEIFNLGVGFLVDVATLSIVVVPCVHHMRGF
jgi:hypothetical protein